MRRKKAAGADSAPQKETSLSKRNLYKFFSNRLAITGMAIVFLFLILAVFAPFLSKYNPSFVNPSIRYLPPSSEHLLGTDSAGRDVATRIIYGGRVSILVGIASAVGAALIGVIMGGFAGYFGGKLDSAILYVSEILMAFPTILLVFILVGFAGRGVLNLIIIFVATGWVGTMRIVRGRVLSLREEAFVESCRANGISSMSIVFRHLLPNTLGPVIVNITLQTGGYVLQEAALSFLGVGVDPGMATWGNMMNAARALNIIQNYPMLWLAPGLTISLFVLGINFFGDGLRDVLDPTQ